jgi:hypothetical protein
MEYTSGSLEFVSKETLCQRGETEEECEAPDGDVIDDVEEVSVDNDLPHPRNRQRLGC